jgi:gingipain R
MKFITYKVLLAFLFCPLLIYGQSTAESVILSQSSNSVEMISESENGLRVRVKLGNFNKQSVEINGKTYFAVNLKEGSVLTEKGNPALPKFTRSIMIPGTSDFVARVVSSKYEDINLPIIPSKGLISRNQNPDEVEYSFSSLYSKDSFYPMSRFHFDEPYLIRDTRGVSLTIYPFAYNPVRNTLRVYTSLELEITFKGTNLKNSIKNIEPNSNKYFETISKSHFINYKAKTSTPSSPSKLKKAPSDFKKVPIVEGNSKMLIISHNDYLAAMKPFVDHKNNKGLITEIVSMTTVGVTADDVKNYIQQRYDKDKTITFVLLVGDHDKVPTMIREFSLDTLIQTGVCDPLFSLVSGNDNYPDIFVGRFSANSVADVETMVERSIFYENMATDQHWFHNGLNIASCEGGPGDIYNQGHIGESDKMHSSIIRNSLLTGIYTTIDTIFQRDSKSYISNTLISQSINGGKSIINYSGHGDKDKWFIYKDAGFINSNGINMLRAITAFNNKDVSELINDDKLPFVFSSACLNGNFTATTCFAESWLRAKNPNTKRPTGAIGFYGASIVLDWQPPMRAQDEFNRLLIQKDDLSNENMAFGALCYRASCSMMDEYGANDKSTGGAKNFLAWNVFGDPSLVVIPYSKGGCPENFTVSNSLNGGTHEFLASNSITASNVISNNANVHYGANNSITLLPGFSVEYGSTFSADLFGCNPYNSLYLVGEQSNEEEAGQNIDKSNEALFNNNIFPNPTHGEFTVRMDLPEQQTSEIRVYDSMGKLVKSVVASATETVVSIEEQPAGIYLVRYTVDGKNHSAKIVKL